MTLAREALLGPSYFYHRRLIEESKGWSGDQIRGYQEKRFQSLIRRYGERVTVKDDYRDNPRRFTRWDMSPLTHSVRTGGTTGQPLCFRADTFARRQKERAYLFDIWSRVGYKPHDLRLCYGVDIYGNDLVRFNHLENAVHVSPGATMEGELGRLRQWIGTLPPFFLHVHPSSLYTFIELLGENLFRSLPVRGVIAGSETFPIVQQQQFEREFGIPVAHWYGHSEYAVLAYCCSACRGFHFYPTYGKLELLPADTEGYHRIVASSFNRLGTQFVRYDTGDLAVSPTGSCRTNNFARVDAIVGRSQETFIDNAGRKRSLFGYIFGDEKSILWDQIRDLLVIQDEIGALRVHLVTVPGANKDEIEQILKQRIPVATLEFEYVAAVDRSPSGKRRYFHSTLAQQ